jgi:hypothetical protein
MIIVSHRAPDNPANQSPRHPGTLSPSLATILAPNLPYSRGEDYTPMSTTEKIADLESIRQRLDELGVRL